MEAFGEGLKSFLRALPILVVLLVVVGFVLGFLGSWVWHWLASHLHLVWR